MADEIATIDDIASHIYQPDTVGRKRCVTPELLYYNVLQGETYHINGSYSNNQLVPLSKISFSSAGDGTDSVWRIKIGHSSNIPPEGLRVQGSIGGHAFDKTLYNKTESVEIKFDDYQLEFYSNVSYIKIARPSVGTNIEIYFRAKDDYNAGFLDIQSLTIDTNQTNGSLPHDNPAMGVINDGDESEGIRPTTAWINIAAPYFNPSLGEYGGRISFTHRKANISLTVSELT